MRLARDQVRPRPALRLYAKSRHNIIKTDRQDCYRPVKPAWELVFKNLFDAAHCQRNLRDPTDRPYISLPTALVVSESWLTLFTLPAQARPRRMQSLREEK